MRTEQVTPWLALPSWPFCLMVLSVALGMGGLGARPAWARIATRHSEPCRTQVEHVLAGSRGAEAHLRQAARDGNLKAQLCLASLNASLDRYRPAADWYAAAARAGDPVAQFDLGVLFDRGLGARRSVARAAHWYRLAARRGNPHAQYNLASLYSHGALGRQKTALAAYWYRRAAHQGLPRAQYRLGVMYHAGVGLGRDNRAAVKWLHSAAEHGLAPAQYDLATLLDSGQGTRPDSARAVRWYRAAADQGNSNAQNNLAIKYQAGNGVARNPGRAAHWFRLAAEKGNPNAQYNLGVMYAYGGGVRRNVVQGDMWLTLAQASSLKAFRLQRGPGSIKRRIEPAMTMHQLIAAAAEAGQWLAGQRLLRQTHRTTPSRPSSPKIMGG